MKKYDFCLTRGCVPYGGDRTVEEEGEDDRQLCHHKDHRRGAIRQGEARRAHRDEKEGGGEDHEESTDGGGRLGAHQARAACDDRARPPQHRQAVPGHRHPRDHLYSNGVLFGRRPLRLHLHLPTPLRSQRPQTLSPDRRRPPLLPPAPGHPSRRTCPVSFVLFCFVIMFRQGKTCC